jgi:beta-galactosidase
MKKELHSIAFLLVICLLGPMSCTQSDSQDAVDIRSARLLDFDWNFHRGDVNNGQSPELDDSAWRRLNLPHDWSIEDIPGSDSPLDEEAIGGIGAGYFVGGTGWYRKTFSVGPDQTDSRSFLEFEGIYMNADVWLNGHHLGSHPYGYTGFGYDITDQLHFDRDNLLAVRVRNEGQTSRWYSGSGIYRHVWLHSTAPVHVKHWGTRITTTEISKESARVEVTTEVVNESDTAREVRLRMHIKDPSGAGVGTVETVQPVAAHGSSEFKQELAVGSPKLWSVETPQLYLATAETYDDDDPSSSGLLDRVETGFGIRSIKFSSEQGFLLNGQPTLLKGGCAHHESQRLQRHSLCSQSAVDCFPECL